MDGDLKGPTKRVSILLYASISFRTDKNMRIGLVFFKTFLLLYFYSRISLSSLVKDFSAVD